MTRPTLDRRTFVAGLALGLPVALGGERMSAQTPRPLVAVTPEELLDTLEHTPIRQRYEGVRLEPAAWEDFDETDYRDAVGGVKIMTTGEPATVFGGYVVFEDEESARDAIEVVEEAHAGTTIQSFPKTIEDHEGVFIEFEEDGYRSVTVIPVRNVLVIGNDADVRGHHGSGAHHGRGRGRHHGEGRHRGEDRQSIGHAAVLVRHLLPILDRHT